MASSGNTWQKKLMNKARLHSLKVRGVKQRFSVADGKDFQPSQRVVGTFCRRPKTYGSTVGYFGVTK